MVFLMDCGPCCATDTWLAEDLVKSVQSTPTLSQNSNRGRDSPKVQRPDQLHGKRKNFSRKSLNQHDMHCLHQSLSPVSPAPVASLLPQPWTTNSDLLYQRCVNTCGSLRLCSDPKFTMRALLVQWHRSRPRPSAQACTDSKANLRLHIRTRGQRSCPFAQRGSRSKQKTKKQLNIPLKLLQPPAQPPTPPTKTPHVHFRPIEHQV